MEDKLNSQEHNEEKVIKFQFLKSPDYSISFINGAICRIAPNWKISLDLYTERLPIPDFGNLIIEKNNEQRFENQYSNPAFVREFQKTIMLDIDVAKEIVNLLSVRIQELEKLNNEGNTTE